MKSESDKQFEDLFKLYTDGSLTVDKILAILDIARPSVAKSGIAADS